MNKLALATLGTTAIVLAACSDATTGTNSSANNNTTLMPSSMATVYAATPIGFDELSTSFNSTGTEGAFLPDFNSHGDDHGPHGGGDDFKHMPGFGLGFMGGGVGGFLLGDGLLNDHFIRFRTGKCAFQTGVGVVCADTTRNGNVVSSKTIKYTTASGTLQQSQDFDNGRRRADGGGEGVEYAPRQQHELGRRDQPSEGHRPDGRGPHGERRVEGHRDEHRQFDLRRLHVDADHG